MDDIVVIRIYIQYITTALLLSATTSGKYSLTGHERVVNNRDRREMVVSIVKMESKMRSRIILLRPNRLYMVQISEPPAEPAASLHDNTHHNSANSKTNE